MTPEYESLLRDVWNEYGDMLIRAAGVILVIAVSLGSYQAQSFLWQWQVLAAWELLALLAGLIWWIIKGDMEEAAGVWLLLALAAPLAVIVAIGIGLTLHFVFNVATSNWPGLRG